MDINERLREDKACSKYGADMGRSDWEGPSDLPYAFHLQKVDFEDERYDLGGAYWGMPANLWCAWDEVTADEQVRKFVRADTWDSAAASIKTRYPNSDFLDAEAERVKAVTAAYIEAMLWAEDERLLEEGGFEFSSELVLADGEWGKVEEDCRDFLSQAAGLLGEWTPSQTGHDFYLTRCGHGAGFWDRGLANGEALSEIARLMGTVDPYVGDDGLVYIE